MQHLNSETIARLVDEPPTPEERKHLAGCPRCAGEIDALAEQTKALAALPLLASPEGVWESLRPKLVPEGIVRAEEVPIRDSASTPPGSAGVPAGRNGSGAGPWRAAWLQAAAALVLFAGGVGVGWGARGSANVPSGTEGDRATTASASEASAGPAPDVGTWDPFTTSSLESAEGMVRAAEDLYAEALWIYREQLEGMGAPIVADPLGRYLALGNVLAVTEAAARSAPADPFLNGLLINTKVEREATLRRISLLSTGTP